MSSYVYTLSRYRPDRDDITRSQGCKNLHMQCRSILPNDPIPIPAQCPIYTYIVTTYCLPPYEIEVLQNCTVEGECKVQQVS